MRACFNALTSLVLAQTYTQRNPLLSDCPSNDGLAFSTFATDFTSFITLPTLWTATSGSPSYSSGAISTISKSGDSPTIQTDFYMLFGAINVIAKAAPGAGIVSCIVLQSDCLDEIDWEWLGGNKASVQTNYFGKGFTGIYDRMIPAAIPGDDAQSTSHNYTIDWRSDKTDRYIDGSLVRSLAYADAACGSQYPQTPMRLKIGNWAAGDTSANGQSTVTWSGGPTNFGAGPFSMVLEKVWVWNANPASGYRYRDQSGNWDSIEILP